MTCACCIAHRDGSRRQFEAFEVEIDPSQETASGLVKVSYASCTNIVTRDQALIEQTLGVLSDSIMRQIEDCLKRVLELP